MKKTLILLTLCIMANINSFGQCPKPKYDFIIGSDKFRFISDIMDKNSLQAINEYYYKDKNHVYYNYKVDIGSARSRIIETLYLIENADPETFIPLISIHGGYASFHPYENHYFARDKNQVYFKGFPIKNADPETFAPLTFHYAKDNARAFFKNCEIENVDLQTFQVKDNGGYYDFSYDKNYIYFHYQKEKIDIETFVMDTSGYRCRDKNNIFHLLGTGFDGYIKKEKIKQL